MTFRLGLPAFFSPDRSWNIGAMVKHGAVGLCRSSFHQWLSRELLVLRIPLTGFSGGASRLALHVQTSSGTATCIASILSDASCDLMP